MLDRNRRWVIVRGLFSFLMTAVLVLGLVGCGERLEIPQTPETEKPYKTQLVAASLSEVAPPPVIEQLSQSLEAYQPQVTIVSPKADEVLQDTKVSVQIKVQDLPIFKNPDLGLGPHLHVILDNQPYKAVYDITQPVVFEDLPPGTHTVRVFPSRPWHESFKNEGAYAQTTFHIFTKTSDNNPDSGLPLLTYSRPTGSYGAEPIMLDFYLTNAPLHRVAQESPDDEIADWRIRVTINGQSFVFDRWQPVYIKGFKPGKNWVKLEFLDEQGNPVKNVFNETVRLLDFEPNGNDTLSKLVRGELSAEAARGIVDPNYEATPTPSPTVTPAPSPSPTVTPTPVPSVAPSVEETPTQETATPEEKPTPAAENATPDSSLPPTQPEVVETPSPQPSPAEAAFPELEPSIAPDQNSSPAKAQEAAPTEESPTETAPAVKDSGTPETLNPEPVAATPN